MSRAVMNMMKGVNADEPRSLSRYEGFDAPLSPRARYPDEWEADPSEQSGFHGALVHWRLLQRHRGVLVLAAVLGALGGVAASLPRTPVYRASTTLEIQGLNRDFLGMQNVSPTESSGSVMADIATQAELLKSRSLIERVVNDLKLSPEDAGAGSEGRLATWKRALGLPEEKPADRLQTALRTARESISVSTRGNSRLLYVSADSTDPGLAAKFANALTDALIRSNVESRWSATQYTEEWLELQLGDLRVKLETSEDRLQAYARETGLQFTADQESLAEEQLSRLQEQLSQARANRIARQSQYELVENNPETALELIENPYRSEFARLNQDLAGLTSTFTDDYPQVKTVKARIAELEKAAKGAQGELLNSLRADYEAAMRTERLLAADYQNQAALVSELDGKSIQYRILKREVDTNRQLYDNLLQKGKEARLSAAMQASPIRIVDRAAPPSRPYKPDHFKSSIIGLIVGLLGGVGFVVVRDRLDRTLRRPGDAEFYLNTPELGLIPSAQPGKRTGPARDVRVKVRYRRSSDALPETGGPPTNGLSGGRRTRLLQEAGAGRLFDLSDRTSHIAESFRSTLTSILFSATEDAPPRCIVISSSFPEEGKSTVVSNLAAALAAINRSVLVIDGDMRRPMLHSVFGILNTVGLTDLLMSPSPLAMDDHDHPAVASTETPGLFVIPSGRSAAAPSNLLHSPRTEELFRWARSKYDYVLIDTPPVAQLPDARLFARYADGVILVIRAGATTRDGALAVVERFRKDETPVLGVVLNGWNPKNGDSSYYGHGGYYHYHDTYFSEAQNNEAS